MLNVRVSTSVREELAYAENSGILGAKKIASRSL